MDSSHWRKCDDSEACFEVKRSVFFWFTSISLNKSQYCIETSSGRFEKCLVDSNKIECCCISTVPHLACRFQFFLDKVLPQYRDSAMSHTFIYIPSYFDYVRLRNYMKKEQLNFTSICEYSSKSEVSRARHFFQKGDRHFVLFTERFHFYKRLVLLIAFRLLLLLLHPSSISHVTGCVLRLKMAEWWVLIESLNQSPPMSSLQRFEENNLYHYFKS